MKASVLPRVLPAFLTVLFPLCPTGSLGDPVSLENTKTRMALPLDTPPLIDGVIGAGEWSRAEGGVSRYWRIDHLAGLADAVRGGVIASGVAPASNADLSADIHVGYDANNLYVAFQVKDANVFTDDAAAGTANGATGEDDSVVLFIDGDNSNFAHVDASGTNPEIISSGGAFAISANNAYRETEAGNPGFGPAAAWEARTGLTAAGYHAEFRISLASIGNPEPGDVIGFTILVNDDDNGGGLERSLVWTGTPNLEATYGNLLIGTRGYLSPAVTVPPSIDGVVSPAEYPGAETIRIDPHTGVYDLDTGDDDFTPDDHAFAAWITHDVDALYVAVRVFDDLIVTDSAAAGSDGGMTWQDDSVEIFFDVDESNAEHFIPGTGPPFDGQYVMSANGAHRDIEAGNPSFGVSADWFAATALSGGGYTVEFKVNKSALAPIPAGGRIGFTIAINDDDGAGRKAQVAWSGRAHSEYTYGTLTLSNDVAPRILSICYDSGGGTASVVWSARPNQLFTLERSSDQQDWTDLDTILSVGTSGEYEDLLPAAMQRAFYRVTFKP
jgi:hypothetical protein